MSIWRSSNGESMLVPSITNFLKRIFSKMDIFPNTIQNTHLKYKRNVQIENFKS